MAESRAQKSARNVMTGVLSKLLLMVLAFATKTIFVRLLGDEYNGVNGLYTNLLSVLALAELGVGNVLNFSLYKALRDNDNSLVCTTVNYFKKLYRGIALAVAIVGVALIPALRYIVNSDLPDDELVIYYVLYLANSVASYLVVYKTTVLNADQKNYISNLVTTCSTCAMYVLQIAYLLVRKDFVGYLVIQVLCTLGGNLVLNHIANRKYPYLNDKSLIDMSRFDKKGLVENIKATFVYKISGVLLNNSDNIIISVMVGTVYVGYYSNYYMVFNYVLAFVSIFITGIIASIGNLNAENNTEKSYGFFRQIDLLFHIIAVVIACCLWNCMQDFVAVWLGAEKVQSIYLLVAIVINCYYTTAMNPVWMFRETMGIFKEVKYVVLVTAIMNIVLSILFGTHFGMPGILIATTVSRFLSQFWFEPKILYQKKFGRSPVSFYLIQLKGVIVCLVAVVLSTFACSFLGHGLPSILLKAVISGMIGLIVPILVNCRTKEWHGLINRVLVKIKK